MTPPLIVTHPQDALLQWPHFTAQDEAAVVQILRDGNVSTHPVIGELESGFAQLTGRQHAVAHCNGTAGLLAAFHALGLAPGDEVLVPTATFWASVLPMIWCGLVPVFCESEPETLGLDPEDVVRRITPRTKAMVIVHLWGLPCKVEELLEIARRHDLKVVEDASHAHGASAGGVPCGRFGDISVFSLQGDKLVPAGEGGILLTDDATYHERVICLGDITRILRLPTAARRFAATSFGTKTRIAPLSAALGLQMLRRLPETNAIRHENHSLLAKTLEPLGFDCFPARAGQERVYFEWMIRPRDESLDLTRLLSLLTAMGCRVGVPRYPLLHQQPFFTESHCNRIGRYEEAAAPDYSLIDLPCTTRINQQMIRLPNFSHRGAGPLIEQYAEAFRQAMALL